MEMAKFENRFLTPIQGFTQSKIEKAILSVPYPNMEKAVIVWKNTFMELNFHRVT